MRPNLSCAYFQNLLAAPVHGAAVHPARLLAMQGAAQRGRQATARPTPDTSATGIKFNRTLTGIGWNFNLEGHLRENKELLLSLMCLDIPFK